ncbi:MAG: tryptophan synthase subunit alpha [Alphaproteobacteria bacterium]|nr:tryptophan synthase subunit alpha [Alphaproteobacteria bacterium]
MTNRIDRRFNSLKTKGRSGLVTFVTAGDPDYARSLEILNALPGAGADLIELGMPFSDPMADGPAIQAASQRALKSGANMKQTFQMVRAFREGHKKTPLVLMGYLNPVLAFGPLAFMDEAAESGVDGLIIVDLPPEEDVDIRVLARERDIHIIRLVAPTTDDARLPVVLKGAGGFLYFVSITGVTGTASADASKVAVSVARLRQSSDLPVAVGFGIKTPGDAAEMAKAADAVVVGSAIVTTIADHLDAPDMPQKVLEQVKALREALDQETMS